MKFKFDLSSLKEKANGVTLIVLLVIIMMGLLGFATWYTIDQTSGTKAAIATVKEEYQNNILLVQNLNKLKANSEYYSAQKAKYDEVVADEGSYTKKGYIIYLDEITRKYDVRIDEMEVGEMQQGENYSSARTSLTVSGEEQDIRHMAEEIIGNEKITRIDDLAFTHAESEPGEVQATMTIVNFTK